MHRTERALAPESALDEAALGGSEGPKKRRILINS